MSALDILKSYLDRQTASTSDAPAAQEQSANPDRDFSEVAKQVPSETVGSGIAAAFRSDKTPDFADMAAGLFGGSNPQQRAGLVGQLLRSVGPGLLATVAGGAFGRMLQGGSAGAPVVPPEVTPQQLNQIDETQVRDMAAAAAKEDPGIMDRVGAYYGQHPEVVKVLGGAALAIALGHMAGRMKQ